MTNGHQYRENVEKAGNQYFTPPPQHTQTEQSANTNKTCLQMYINLTNRMLGNQLLEYIYPPF